MSEPNGHGESRLDRMEEQLERLQASHVKLMTDHEVFVGEQDKAWHRHEQFMEQHREWLRSYDARCEKDRLDRVALDKRITDLVSGMGEFMRRETSPRPGEVKS